MCRSLQVRSRRRASFGASRAWLALAVALQGCGARTGLGDGDVDARADVVSPADGACCPSGMVRVYDLRAGCGAIAKCVVLGPPCGVPPLAECSCATHRPILVDCQHGEGSGVPVTGESSCLPEAGVTEYVPCDPDAGPVDVVTPAARSCPPSTICGHLDGATTFTCCDPAIECGRCVE